MSSASKPSCEFLVGLALAERITQVAAGGQVRCAVAFWSDTGVSKVFPRGVPKNARIFCDISMGSTSADALEALQAPNNPNLRHSVRMHAKVFISNMGLVVGSANASASALGNGDGPASNTEAGIFHLPDTTAWESAVAWFDQFFKTSPKVSDEEVEWAKLIYRPKLPVLAPRRIKSGSLFDLVTAAPWRFSKVGFAFSSIQTTKEEKDEVRRLAKENEKSDPGRIDELSGDGIFKDWGENDVRRWPEYFFSFWQPKSRLTVCGCRIEVKIRKNGSLMTSRDLRGLRALCDVKLPSTQDIGKADAGVALKLRGGESGVLYANGSELAARIVEISGAGFDR